MYPSAGVGGSEERKKETMKEGRKRGFAERRGVLRVRSVGSADFDNK